jgi:hypothetical protein
MCIYFQRHVEGAHRVPCIEEYPSMREEVERGPKRAVEIVCAATFSRKEMAMGANMRAFRSTYLDIGLGHIGRLTILAHVQAETSEEQELTNPLTRILLEPVWATGAG